MSGDLAFLRLSVDAAVMRKSSLRLLIAGASLCVLVGCAGPSPTAFRADSAEARLHVLNRVTWGPNASSARELEAMGIERFIEGQLKPGAAVLPPQVQAQIDAMTISQRTLDEIVYSVDEQRRAGLDLKEPEQRAAARRRYQQELNRIAREAAARSLLRAIHSPNQLHEQMTWFWTNHFSVFQFKSNVRAMVADYEESAIRPHALGKFRTLLGATAHHPAMLRYLDNVQNGANRINENYARELMELHTLGANGGYTQTDVQELARILTGLTWALTPNLPKPPSVRETDFVRRGVFVFNPARHDYGDKVFLGRQIKGSGLSELAEALDLLARHPSTARHISRKLAVFFVADDPSQALVERMARTFQSTEGDIAATLRVMFASDEFAASAGLKFKDPMHFVISALRLGHEDRPILSTAPVMAWLNRLGQGLYNRETPDGYPLIRAAWVSPGQMTARFEVARAIGSGSAALFNADASQAEETAIPQLFNAFYRDVLYSAFGPATHKALEQARTREEWNTYLLSSPEFMSR